MSRQSGPSRCTSFALVLLVVAVLPGRTRADTGQEAIVLPAPRHSSEVSVEKALRERRSVRDFADRPLPLEALSQLLWAAQGVTHPRGLRTAPSAGALYPLEIFVVAGAVEELPAGVYRYEQNGHRLRRQAGGDVRPQLARAALEQEWVADAPAILVVVGVYERSARKYGRRAPRYVHMEVGHASQNVYLQAEALGIGTCAVGAFRDRELAVVLSLPASMAPQLVLPVGWPAKP
jgi:SagB-type dehydrogenase family enzyme